MTTKAEYEISNRNRMGPERENECGSAREMRCGVDFSSKTLAGLSSAHKQLAPVAGQAGPNG